MWTLCTSQGEGKIQQLPALKGSALQPSPCLRTRPPCMARILTAAHHPSCAARCGAFVHPPDWQASEGPRASLSGGCDEERLLTHRRVCAPGPPGWWVPAHPHLPSDPEAPFLESAPLKSLSLSSMKFVKLVTLHQRLAARAWRRSAWPA